MRFVSRDGVPEQVVDPYSGFRLGMVDLASLAAMEREKVFRGLAQQESQRPFDLAGGLWCERCWCCWQRRKMRCYARCTTL